MKSILEDDLHMSNYSNISCTGKSSCGCDLPVNTVNIRNPLQIILYLAGVLLFIVGIVFSPGGYLEFSLFALSYIIFGGGVLLRAFRNLARGRIFDENFLMAIATVGAFAIGEYPEGVAVMVFYQIGELLQDSALGRSRRSIEQLMDIRPDYANLKEGEQTRKVSPEQVAVGSSIIIRPGEKVPLDGVIVEGSSALDISALTGESLPREVETGDEVLSGSVNKTGLLGVRVTREYMDSTVSRILSLVENASSRKARTEQFITRFAAYYTPIVVIAALLLAFIPPLFIPGQELQVWTYRALVFLVISCPCALVISIPLGFFGGIGGASRKGILVKGGNYLEALSHVETVIFDKTGTLTHGKFSVNLIEPSDGYSRNELLQLGAAAAYHSNHPVSVSVLQAYNEQIDEKKLKNYEEIPGRGVSVSYEGKKILMGNGKMLSENGVEALNDNDNKTRVHIALEGRYAGSIVVADQIREDAKSAIRQLRDLGVKTIVLLSGDKKNVAEEVGRRLKLDQVYAELLPDQKVEIIEQLERQNTTGKKLVFVGDGINDAPSLARAEVGVAMGGVASDAAIEAADVVLMTGQPSKLAEAIRVAMKTRTIVIQNIVLALGVKGIVMSLGLFGLASMWGAVFADVGVALLAVLNAMRAMK
ncbi:MAG: cadmium-translocating P-type ATPase [Firmicutes bacterium]|nr:cadmium-translocating P-type ATPase [Bacillota bacterium]